jgi:hypothetical protein
MDFGVGTAGADAVFASDYTIAVLVKATSTSRGLLGAFTDTSAGTAIREFFLSNNSGGRLFGNGDFSNGFPDPGTVGSPGLADDVWRWVTMSKATGSAHYKNSYADLATLTWVDGESVGAGNHSDNATAAGMFTTYANYSNGFDSGDCAAICIWPTQLTTGQIHSSCTQAAADLISASAPVVGWLFPQATSGSTILDFTGGGADEISRPFVATSADPPSFNFSFPVTISLSPSTFDISTVSVATIPGVTVSLAPAPLAIAPVSTTPVPGVVNVSLVNQSIVFSTKSITPVPGVINIGLVPAYVVITTASIGNIPVNTSFFVVYNTDIPVSTSFSILFDISARISKSVSLVYDTHSFVTQAKVFNLLFDVHKIISKSFAFLYQVNVPVSSDKNFDLVYDVRTSVTKSASVVYDTGFTSSGTVSKSFSIFYHILKTPTIDKVITVPVMVDSIPPQIVTTSF